MVDRRDARPARLAVLIAVGLSIAACLPAGPTRTAQPTASAVETAIASPSPSVLSSSSGPSPTATPAALPSAPFGTPTRGAWQEIPLVPGRPGELFTPEGIVANDRGYVVYGRSSVVEPEAGSDVFSNVGLWFSPDGRQWTELGRTDDQSGSFASAAAASADRFVVVGLRGGCIPHAECPIPGDAGIASWTSSDGTAWQYNPQVIDLGGLIRSVASDGRSFVAVGSESPGPDAGPAIWRSDDGVTWEAVQPPDVDELETVAGNPTGYVATGFDRGTFVGAERYSFWHSSDGRAWERMGEFVDQVCCGPAATAFGRDRVVAVGAGDCDGQVIGAGWYATAPDGTWERSEHSVDLDGSYLWAITAVSDGFLAVGNANVGSSERVTAWTTADGHRWSLASYLTDPGDWGVEGVAANDHGVAVVGWESLEFGTDDAGGFNVWFLPRDSSPGVVELDRDRATDGCDVARVGTGLRREELEAHLDIDGDLRFAFANVDGTRVRRGSDSTGDVEVLIFGDDADVMRIEVRARGTQRPSVAGMFYWLDDEALLRDMEAVEYGELERAEGVAGGLSVVLRRVDHPEWDLELVAIPAE